MNTQFSIIGIENKNCNYKRNRTNIYIWRYFLGSRSK